MRALLRALRITIVEEPATISGVALETIGILLLFGHIDWTAEQLTGVTMVAGAVLLFIRGLVINGARKTRQEREEARGYTYTYMGTPTLPPPKPGEPT